MSTPTIAIAPHSLDAALAHVANGGRLFVPSYTRSIIIDQRTVARFAKANARLIWEDGDGYRIASGRKSVYIYPGLLKAID